MSKKKRAFLLLVVNNMVVEEGKELQNRSDVLIIVTKNCKFGSETTNYFLIVFKLFHECKQFLFMMYS